MIPTYLPGIPIHPSIIDAFDESLIGGIDLEFDIWQETVEGQTFFGAKLQGAPDATKRYARSRRRALAFVLEDLAKAIK